MISKAITNSSVWFGQIAQSELEVTATYIQQMFYTRHPNKKYNYYGSIKR